MVQKERRKRGKRDKRTGGGGGEERTKEFCFCKALYNLRVSIRTRATYLCDVDKLVNVLNHSNAVVTELQKFQSWRQMI